MVKDVFFDKFFIRMHTVSKIIDQTYFIRRFIRLQTEYLTSDFQRIVHFPQVFIFNMFRLSIVSGQVEMLYWLPFIGWILLPKNKQFVAYNFIRDMFCFSGWKAFFVLRGI